ncbi:uncharacterized protein LOC133311201 [Gastrolobium bilobum]|uniref:uncharacterized protein LOC133311201 n=1 Tax=Gastrolobium bilobum TaxID=150636 RepID=UPI002AB09544|nr:uncharacterized protein LOC133311201 [Gastrolobium bilobum]
MEAQSTQQPTPPPLSSVSPHHSYPDSVDSSPRSRNTDSWDEPYPPPTSNKLRLMCSYGGHIVPRPHDRSLCYVGGDTRILVVDRHTSLSDLSARLSKTFLNGNPFSLKYQLPSEDLDSLVSVTTDEDLDNMIDEYDHRTLSSSSKPSRIRLFLFPAQPNSLQSIGPVQPGSATTKSDDWFLDALNTGRVLSDSSSVNCLLGLDDEVAAAAAAAVGNDNSNNSNNLNSSHPGNGKNLKQGQDVHSVPDSPMLETNSSFGSTSSLPSIANLPPIRVHAEDGGGNGGGGFGTREQDQKVLGIEEQFAQLGVGGVEQNSQPQHQPPAPAANVSVAASQSQTQTQPQSQALPPQFQQKSAGVVDLPSPDSVSSDRSLSNAMSRPIPVIYQDQVQIQSGTSRVPNTSVDPNLYMSDPYGGIQMQQHLQEHGYVLQQQFDQQQQQQQQHHQHQEAQQAQQFIHGTHLIHHTPSGPVPIPAYYPVYQQQLHPQHHHQLDQQYQVYYVPARQAQPYNLSMQQANIGESATTISSSQPQNQPNPAPSAAYNPMRNAPLPISEMAAGSYRTAAATPQFVQVPAGQHQQQYVAYSQIHHHPSQPVAPNSAVPANYAYDYADSAYAEIFYTQPLAPSMPSQYQTMTPAEVSAQLPSDNMKQQIRTSQQL